MWAQRKQFHFGHLTNSPAGLNKYSTRLVNSHLGAGWAHRNCFSKAMRPLWLQWKGHMLGLVFQMMHTWQHIKTLQPLSRLLLSPSQVSTTLLLPKPLLCQSFQLQYPLLTMLLSPCYISTCFQVWSSRTHSPNAGEFRSSFFHTTELWNVSSSSRFSGTSWMLSLSFRVRTLSSASCF